MWRNTSQRWGSVSIVLHWLSALAVIGMFASGWWMTTLSYYDSWYHRAPWWHKSFGIALLAVTVLRVTWRLASVTPVAHGHRHERRAALAGHVLLYLLLFAVMSSGYLIATAEGKGIEVFGWFSVPALTTPFAEQATVAGTIHWYCAWALIVLAAGHALFALKHHYVDRTDTLTRMLGLHARSHDTHLPDR